MSQPTAPASPKKAKLAAALRRNMARRKAVERCPLPVAGEEDAGTEAGSGLRSRGEPEAEGRTKGGGESASTALKAPNKMHSASAA